MTSLRTTLTSRTFLPAVYFLAFPPNGGSFGTLKPHLPAAAPEIFDSSQRSALFDSWTLTRTPSSQRKAANADCHQSTSPMLNADTL